MLSVRNRTAAGIETASSSILDPQMHKMKHPRPPFVSRGTSFSSINMDNLPLHHPQPPQPISGSSSVYDEDYYNDVGTAGSSLLYPKSEKSGGSENSYLTPTTHPRRAHSTSQIPRPPRAYSRTSISPPAPRSTKRPMSYQYGNTQNPNANLFSTTITANNSKYAPLPSKFQNSSVPILKEPRRGVLARQAVESGSARSSGIGTGRTRSHLNEVQVAEYGGVDGRL